jgi:hypothetical protein
MVSARLSRALIQNESYKELQNDVGRRAASEISESLDELGPGSYLLLAILVFVGRALYPARH